MEYTWCTILWISQTELAKHLNCHAPDAYSLPSPIPGNLLSSPLESQQNEPRLWKPGVMRGGYRVSDWEVSRHLPQRLRCPDQWMLLAGLCTYSTVGVLHLIQGSKYWADCGLIAMVGAVLTGLWHGESAMMDAFVLGGFLSLLASKVLVRFVGIPGVMKGGYRVF